MAEEQRPEAGLRWTAKRRAALVISLLKGETTSPTLLLDGSFASNALWSTLAEQGIDLLCPSGRTDRDGDWIKRSSRPGKFTKRNFHYIPREAFIDARRVVN